MSPNQILLNVILAAGGKIVGRTKLQKTVYLLTATNLIDNVFSFEYHHYGPYSEELSNVTKIESWFGEITETEAETEFGGKYSIFNVAPSQVELDERLRQFASIAANASSVELELVATAVFLNKQGVADAWAETARRKPEKATQHRLEKSKALYASLKAVATPAALPVLN